MAPAKVKKSVSLKLTVPPDNLMMIVSIAQASTSINIVVPKQLAVNMAALNDFTMIILNKFFERERSQDFVTFVTTFSTIEEAVGFLQDNGVVIEALPQ